ncbi:MAG: hypothetical protein D3916_12340, partial [Candidatus Electrothrix sp. MAN1_4]|nr:hypothetical protein [Candidatus Electrothrix sp. MAN1_4]
ATPADWKEGLVVDGKGGSLEVDVTGSGWLGAWIDFNGDGLFSGSGEMIINQAVTSGKQPCSFDIPAGALSAPLYVRFRLYGEEPPVPQLAYKGTAENGEVEDMRFDFGTSPGTIGDRVWLDENSDGVQDAGEVGISGITVLLKDSGGTTVDTAVTDSNGNYMFKNVASGTYTVQVDTLPAELSGLELIFDEDGTTASPNGETSVTVTAGGEHLTADFGYNWVVKDDTDNPEATDTGAIGDRIWNDADNDGVQDPNEVGIVGIEVNLWRDDNGDGIYDTSAGSVTTGPDGRYIFDGLAPDSYVVEVDTTDLATAGYNTTPTGDPDNTFDGKTTSPVIVAPGDVFVNADFGYNINTDGNLATPESGGGSAIGDTIFLDVNADGNFTAGTDQGIGGVSVVLKDNSGNILATAITLPSISVIDGYIDLDGDDVTAGTDTGDAGQLLGYTIINGMVDVDGNGSIDSSDDGNFGGIAVIDGRLNMDGNASVDVDDDGDLAGMYQFSGLPDGNYTVKVVDNANMLDGLDATAFPTGGSAYEGNPNLSGSDNFDQDFGYAPVGHSVGKGLIGDTIYLDSNDDGNFDAGEGIESVTVQLYDSTGSTLLATTSTDGYGRYEFANLDASATYQVHVDINTLPNGGTGLTNSIDPEGNVANQSTINLASDPDGVNDGINTAQDFGYTADTPNSISGTIWNDTNADGELSGETGVFSGVTVVLRDESTGNIVATTFTDASGNYSFGNLPDDTYTV